MRFDREPWVKLYKHEGPQHRLMSLESRCFRDFLLRFAKSEDGVLLERSNSPFRDLCRVVAADGAYSRKVKKWCAELIDVGYLTIDDSGKITIKRFVEAQVARSKNAERQARWKRKKREERETSPGDSSETLPSDVTGNAPETLQREEKRREEKRDPPPPPQGGEVQELQVPCPSPVLPQDAVEQLAGHYQVSVALVRETEKSFKNYWIAGKGSGKRFTRGVWMAKCREWIRRAYEAGELKTGSDDAKEDPWDN